VGGSERKDLICVLINDKSEEETFYLGCQVAKASNLSTLVVTFITNRIKQRIRLYFLRKFHESSLCPRFGKVFKNKTSVATKILKTKLLLY